MMKETLRKSETVFLQGLSRLCGLVAKLCIPFGLTIHAVAVPEADFSLMSLTSYVVPFIVLAGIYWILSKLALKI